MSMKIIGIVLIAAGILMLVMKGFSFTQEKKVVDIGPIEINAKEKKTVAWPTYAGVIAIVAGVALVALDRKKTNG
jgi:drug/metabolite transporter (DMT)-like permease